jgi:TonB-dependent SusC/RagA subfamily outer membrane receptor
MKKNCNRLRWDGIHRPWVKILIAMKLTVILSLLLFTQTFALKSYSQRTLLNLKMENVTIKEVLRTIEDKSEYFFLYNDDLINVSRIVSIDAKNEKIQDVLSQLFTDQNITFLIKDRQIVLSPLPVEASSVSVSVIEQQNKTIKGKVTDSSGSPLPGVTVVVKGTTNGNITDTNGNYSLSNIPENATLQFSFVGMKAQEVAVGTKTTINVTLAEETVGIEEVVAVGYGTQKKVNLTGSISTVKFDEAITNRPLTNVSQALGGAVTGVWVSQNSGKPGNDESQLRVRGWGTMNNSNPLVIIDGVEGSFNQLNTNDIESISVLKDAASAAIYGSKAASGVILITTKLGQHNEKMQINLSSYFGIQSLGRRYDVINNSVEYMELWNQALVNEGSSPLFPDYLISAFKNGNDPYKYPNTNWYDELFKTAPISTLLK